MDTLVISFSGAPPSLWKHHHWNWADKRFLGPERWRRPSLSDSLWKLSARLSSFPRRHGRRPRALRGRRQNWRQPTRPRTPLGRQVWSWKSSWCGNCGCGSGGSCAGGESGGCAVCDSGGGRVHQARLDLKPS